MRYLLLIVLSLLLLSRKYGLALCADCSCGYTFFRRLADDDESSCKNGEYTNGTCLCYDE